MNIISLSFQSTDRTRRVLWLFSSMSLLCLSTWLENSLRGVCILNCYVERSSVLPRGRDILNSNNGSSRRLSSYCGAHVYFIRTTQISIVQTRLLLLKHLLFVCVQILRGLASRVRSYLASLSKDIRWCINSLLRVCRCIGFGDFLPKPSNVLSLV